MFIPSIKKFDLNPETNHYEKRVIVDDVIFIISVPATLWNVSNRRAINRWLKSNPKLDGKFPYGTITKEDNITIHDVCEYKCEYCSKELLNLTYKRKHMEKCSHRVLPDEEDTPLVNEVIRQTTINNTTNTTNTTNNTTNTTNNNDITVNIQINSFGKENPKWLTERVLGNVFRDQVNGIASLIKAKHFNDAFPENQNIRIDTKNNLNNYVQLYENGRWRIKQTKPTLDTLLIHSQDMITSIIDTNNMLDEDNEEEAYHAKLIKDFQETDHFKDNKDRLDRKWANVSDILTNRGPEYKKIMSSIKTIMLDQNLSKGR